MEERDGRDRHTEGQRQRLTISAQLATSIHSVKVVLGAVWTTGEAVLRECDLYV